MNILNTYMPGIARQSEVTGHFMAVLVNGGATYEGAADSAVYIGIVNCDPCDPVARERASWFVAGSGSKQTYKSALAYFPSLKESEYRL